jgi:hypothetical protein
MFAVLQWSNWAKDLRRNEWQVCHSAWCFPLNVFLLVSSTCFEGIPLLPLLTQQLRCPTNDTIMHCGFEEYTPLAATYGIAVSAAFFAVEVRVTDTTNSAVWAGELFGLLIFKQRQLILYLQTFPLSVNSTNCTVCGTLHSGCIFTDLLETCLCLLRCKLRINQQAFFKKFMYL